MEYENHYYIICLHYINLVTAVEWVVQLSHAGFFFFWSKSHAGFGGDNMVF